MLKALYYKCLEWGRYEGANPARRVRFFPDRPAQYDRLAAALAGLLAPGLLAG